MRIKLSEETYHLIHSLSSTEKAYFKKQNSGPKESNLVTAFDIINAAKNFNENAINQQHVKNGINPNSIYKRLIPALLKSMAQYQSGNTVKLQLNEILNHVAFLLSKELYKLCDSQLEKGLELATAHELFSYQIEFLARKQTLMLKRVDKPGDSDFELVEQATYAAENLKRQLTYKYLIRKVFALTQVERISANARTSIINEILGHELMETKTEGLPSIEMQRKRIKAMACFFTGQWEKALEVSKEIIATTPDIDKLPYAALSNHLSVIINIAQMEISLYNGKGYMEHLKLIQGILDKNPHITPFTKAQFENFQQQLQLAHLVCSGQLNVALEKANKLLNTASDTSLNNIDRKSLMLTISYVYFLQEKFSNAIAYINKEFFQAEEIFLNDKASWVELLCVFMKKDELAFESKWRSWNRQLKKINSGFSWEKYVMGALKKAFKKPKAEQQEIMKSLHKQLAPLKFEIRTSLTSTIDILLWVESIALGKPTAILLKEKYLG